MCLKQQKLIFSQLWRRGVQGQGVGRIGFSWGLPPSCANPCPQVFSVLPGPLPCGYRWLLPSRSHVTFTSLKIHLKYVRTRVWAFKMNLDTVQTVIVITWWEFEVHPILSLYHVWFTSWFVFSVLELFPSLLPLQTLKNWFINILLGYTLFSVRNAAEGQDM